MFKEHADHWLEIALKINTYCGFHSISSGKASKNSKTVNQPKKVCIQLWYQPQNIETKQSIFNSQRNGIHIANWC